jgi:L-aspartate oxidase
MAVELPKGCIGRSREKWRPLKRVAVAADGRWPAVADTLIGKGLAEDAAEREAGLKAQPPGMVLLADLHRTWPDGEPFMHNHDPKWKDLAPRDVVARSIHREMLARDVNNVYLDLRSYVPRDEILRHFPTIYEQALQFGVDITEDLVPVVPAAHYACGGVWVDEWGQTTLKNLYAVGEVACTGLHGANRLASTSLLEGLVWGRRAAQHIECHLAEQTLYDTDLIPVWAATGDAVADPALLTQDMSVIKHIMWNYVGLVRTGPRLARALRDLRSLESEIENFYRTRRLTDDLIGLRNAVRTAIIVTNAAWQNKVSMGCHYRE